MPCDSSHMEATGFEVAMSRVFQLLDELDGKPIDPSGWAGYDRRAYNMGISSPAADAAVAKLCAACEALGPAIKGKSLELQMWWRDHQAADAKKKAGAEERAKQENEREKALAKLSPAERKALGVKD